MHLKSLLMNRWPIQTVADRVMFWSCCGPPQLSSKTDGFGSLSTVGVHSSASIHRFSLHLDFQGRKTDLCIADEILSNLVCLFLDFDTSHTDRNGAGSVYLDRMHVLIATSHATIPHSWIVSIRGWGVSLWDLHDKLMHFLVLYDNSLLLNFRFCWMCTRIEVELEEPK